MYANWRRLKNWNSENNNKVHKKFIEISLTL